MNPITKSWLIFRYLGPRIIWLRARGYFETATGRTKRHNPLRTWESISLAEMLGDNGPTDAMAYGQFKASNPPAFLFPLGEPPALGGKARGGAAADRTCLPTAAGVPQESFIERIRLIEQDRFTYFFASPSPKPIDWYENTLTGGRADAVRAWYDIPNFRPESGDMRALWEPARATWAFDLARGRAHALPINAAALYWRWVDSWMAACPPFRGWQWKCGQEAAVRLIALSLGFWALHGAATPTNGWLQFARIAWITAQRIAGHIHYAISQKNNHALSEAVGLMLVAHLFPEFKQAAEWKEFGRRVLMQEMRRQMYSDGSYVQHSMNYHRVMLNVCTLGLRIAELSGEPLDRDLYDRLAAAAEFVYQMMEPSSGWLPNYGHNDGALVLPLSNCGFNDYRPAIQSAYFVAHRKRLLAAGPWDEELVWLFGPDVRGAPAAEVGPPTSVAFSTGGYYTLRSDESWAMVRCHTYKDRQGQLDSLHVDLWWRGLNVLCDAGTYQYYTPKNRAIERYFKSTASHNVVQMDRREPAELVSRFLWLPWSKARERRYEVGEQTLVFEGESGDYGRSPTRVIWRRAVVCLPLGTWLIVDDLLGNARHRAVLYWHLLDCPAELTGGACRLRTPKGDLTVEVATAIPGELACELPRGVETPVRVQGWTSRYYGHREATPVLEATRDGMLPVRLVTTVGPDAGGRPTFVEQTPAGERWRIYDGAAATVVELGPGASGESFIFRSVGESGVRRT